MSRLWILLNWLYILLSGRCGGFKWLSQWRRKCTIQAAERFWVGPNSNAKAPAFPSNQVQNTWGDLLEQIGLISTNLDGIAAEGRLHFDRSSTSPPLTLEYSLFRSGISSLRTLDHSQQSWVSSFSKPVAALLLLIHGEADAAHEVILGVNMTNIETAERVAQLSPAERQAYDWMSKHPLSVDDHWIHSLIHQYEGSAVGEGNYTGWENAQYWIAGGPQKWKTLNEHPVSKRLREYLQQQLQQLQQQKKAQITDNDTSDNDNSLECLQQLYDRLIVTSQTPRKHSIIAGGGEHRTVTVPPNTWDSIAWIGLLEETQMNNSSHNLSTSNDSDDSLATTTSKWLRDLQKLEIMWLLEYCWTNK